MDNGPVRINDLVSGGRNAGGPSSDPRRGAQRPNAVVKKSKLKTILLASAGVVLLAALVVGGWFIYRSSVSAQIDANKYQAVFFTNGQVYFGKLHNLNGGYYRLSDIFYLQAQAPAEADADGSENPQSTSAEQASDVQLIKLGSEVHGPDDEMIMNKDQILFFENLKTDGKVTDSINKYNSQKK